MDETFTYKLQRLKDTLDDREKRIQDTKDNINQVKEQISAIQKQMIKNSDIAKIAYKNAEIKLMIGNVLIFQNINT